MTDKEELLLTEEERQLILRDRKAKENLKKEQTEANTNNGKIAFLKHDIYPKCKEDLYF